MGNEYNLEDDVSTWSDEELREARAFLIAKVVAARFTTKLDALTNRIWPKYTAPTDEERRAAQESTMTSEGDDDGNPAPPSVAMTAWNAYRRRQVEHDQQHARKAAMMPDITQDELCIGYPGCPLDHESMSVAEFVKHVEG